MDEINFAYGVIIIVGVLAAGILGLIATSPDDIIQPRITSVEENLTACIPHSISLLNIIKTNNNIF